MTLAPRGHVTPLRQWPPRVNRRRFKVSVRWPELSWLELVFLAISHHVHVLCPLHIRGETLYLCPCKMLRLLTKLIRTVHVNKASRDAVLLLVSVRSILRQTEQKVDGVYWSSNTYSLGVSCKQGMDLAGAVT